MDQKVRATRGWLGEPPLERDYNPSHALKWYKMMGATELLPARRKRGGAISAERGWIGDPQPPRE